jgi:hypothetical protein
MTRRGRHRRRSPPTRNSFDPGIEGWVYVFVNPSLPAMVKIGHSMQDPVLRVRDLDNAGTPTAPRLAFKALVLSPEKVERAVHGALAAFNVGREWFAVDLDHAIRTIAENATTIFRQVRLGEAAGAPPAPLEPPAPIHSDAIAERVVVCWSCQGKLRLRNSRKNQPVTGICPRCGGSWFFSGRVDTDQTTF